MILGKSDVWIKFVWFISYGLKCSHPIRLQYSLIINICRRKESSNVLDYCMGIIIIKESQDLGLPRLVGCGQFYLSANHISGFFHHHYLLNRDILFWGGGRIRGILPLHCTETCFTVDLSNVTLVFRSNCREEFWKKAVLRNSHPLTLTAETFVKILEKIPEKSPCLQPY